MKSMSTNTRAAIHSHSLLLTIECHLSCGTLSVHGLERALTQPTSAKRDPLYISVVVLIPTTTTTTTHTHLWRFCQRHWEPFLTMLFSLLSEDPGTRHFIDLRWIMVEPITFLIWAVSHHRNVEKRCIVHFAVVHLLIVVIYGVLQPRPTSKMAMFCTVRTTCPTKEIAFFFGNGIQWHTYGYHCDLSYSPFDSLNNFVMRIVQKRSFAGSYLAWHTLSTLIINHRRFLQSRPPLFT